MKFSVIILIIFTPLIVVSMKNVDNCFPKLIKKKGTSSTNSDESNLNTAFLGQFDRISPAHQLWEELKSPRTVTERGGGSGGGVGGLKLAHFFSSKSDSQALDAYTKAKQLRSKSFNSSTLSSASSATAGAAAAAATNFRNLFKKERSKSLGASSKMAAALNLNKNSINNASSSSSLLFGADAGSFKKTKSSNGQKMTRSRSKAGSRSSRVGSTTNSSSHQYNNVRINSFI